MTRIVVSGIIVSGKTVFSEKGDDKDRRGGERHEQRGDPVAERFPVRRRRYSLSSLRAETGTGVCADVRRALSAEKAGTDFPREHGWYSADYGAPWLQESRGCLVFIFDAEYSVPRGEEHMKEKTEQIRQELETFFAGDGAKDLSGKEFQEFKFLYLGKTGKISALSKEMRSVAPEDRPKAGVMISELRKWAEELFAEKELEIKKRELDEKIAKERIDVTEPGVRKSEGSVHPVTLVRRELTEIFTGMGFSVFEGPEIERDYYNFQALNIPADHPARDMQDTFFVGGEYLLRSQTSSGQIRVMEKQAPPIKIICPGRVYRSDSDATHSPMFHQMEGLVVDRKITLCDLKGILDEFAKRMFSSSTKTRFRPSYFPFTEPSVEVDLSCSSCGGKGCRICKGTGWIEVLGAGMVNRRVLENCGVDPDEYTGFAFGLGLERIAMIKYGIGDIRLLFESDVRFLRQFRD